MNQRIGSSEGDKRATLEAQKEKVKRGNTDKSSGRNGPKILLKIKFNSAETVQKVPGRKELQTIDLCT